MEAGAAFLLLLILIFVVIVGGGLWLLTSTLRRRKLNRHEDKIDSSTSQSGLVEAEQNGNGHRDDQDAQPEHTRVSNEQHSRSIPRQ